MRFLEVIWSNLQGPRSKVPAGHKASHEFRSNCRTGSCCSGPWVLKEGWGFHSFSGPLFQCFAISEWKKI